jgi:hypothetical protein
MNLQKRKALPRNQSEVCGEAFLHEQMREKQQAAFPPINIFIHFSHRVFRKNVVIGDCRGDNGCFLSLERCPSNLPSTPWRLHRLFYYHHYYCIPPFFSTLTL